MHLANRLPLLPAGILLVSQDIWIAVLHQKCPAEKLTAARGHLRKLRILSSSWPDMLILGRTLRYTIAYSFQESAVRLWHVYFIYCLIMPTVPWYQGCKTG